MSIEVGRASQNCRSLTWAWAQTNREFDWIQPNNNKDMNMNAMTVGQIVDLVTNEASQLAQRVGISMHKDVSEFVRDYIESGKRMGINEQSIEEDGFYLRAMNFSSGNKGYEVEILIICTRTKSRTWSCQGDRRIIVEVPKTK